MDKSIQGGGSVIPANSMMETTAVPSLNLTDVRNDKVD